MKIKKQHKGIITPEKTHPFDAGYDLFAPEQIIVEPYSITNRICLGIAFEIEEGFCGVVTERSSQGRFGIITTGNLVDCKYTGCVHVTLANLTDTEYRVYRDEKVCQIYFPKIWLGELELINKLNETERGEKSHGSTGNTSINAGSLDGNSGKVVFQK